MQRKNKNIAARMGRWSAAHRKTAIIGWFVVIVVAFMGGNMAGLATIDDADSGTGESGRGDKVVQNAFPVDDKSAHEQIHIQSASKSVNSPEFKAVVADVSKNIATAKGVTHVDSPYTRGGEAQISPTGHSATVTFRLTDTETTPAADLVDGTVAATAASQKAHSDYRIEQFGEASADAAVEKSLSSDFSKAMTLSLPITLIILIVAFGTLVAAGIPLLLALTGVMGAMGLTALGSAIVPMEDSINEVILLIGLAVGIDYSLFYLRREREERAAGKGEEAALEAAAATSGHAVLISGFTVIVAMAGMFLAGSSTFTSFGVGAILAVAVAMVGSLTVLPAMLSKLGSGVERGRIPFLSRLKRGGAGESRIWNAILKPVLRHPVISTVTSVAVLVALAVPAFHMHTADSGVDGVSQQIPIMKTYKRLVRAFPGAQQPAVIVVQAKDVTTPAVKGGIEALKTKARATKGVDNSAIQVDVSKDKSVAQVSVPLVGNGNDKASIDALANVRKIVPETVGGVAGVDTSVTGTTASSVDFNSLMKSRAPIVFAFVLTLAFGLMLVTFRSVVIPIKAIILNLLSVGAAYGVLTLVFQDGWFEKQLGFHHTGAVAPWLPLFLFVVLFGLSMDYHVFILSRIRELHDRGMGTEQAVEQGIKSTAGVVTSAAIVMVAVFAIFASLSFLDLKMMGVGLGTAVLLDATLIRGVLLPASMTLLGDANWYLPSWLEWLPGGDEKPDEAEVYDREATPTGQLGTELS